MKRIFLAFAVAAMTLAPAIAGDNLTAPVGINTTSPVGLRLQVGNGTRTDSANSEVLINQIISGGSGNGHSLGFNQDIDRAGGIGWAANDDWNEILGTYNYDHYAGYQARARIKTTGTTNTVWGYFSQPQVHNGTVPLLIHYDAVNAAEVSGGSITEQIGFNCGVMNTGTTNYCLKSQAPVYVNAKFDVRGPSGELARFSTITSTSADRWITVGAQELDSEGFRLGYNGSSGNGYFSCNYITCKVEIRSQNGVKVSGMLTAPSGSKAVCWKDGEMFVSSGSSCP